MALDTQTFIEVLNTLEGVPFPARKTDIINAARQNNAGSTLQEACQKLPDTIRFASPQEVIQRLELGR